MHSTLVTRALPPPRAARTPLCIALALVLAACTEPRFPDDAGAETAASPGAPDTGVHRADGTGLSWVGRYVSRSFLYSLDGLLRPSAEELSLIVIKADGAGYTLERESCMYEGHVAFVLEGYLRYEYPPGLPPVRVAFLPEGTGFSTGVGKYTLGFTHELPAECDAGTQAPSQQSWLSESCKCPEDPEALPTSEDDCRVRDPEHDGEAGAKFDVLVSSGATWTYHTVQEVQFQYVNGYRGRNGLYADIDTSARTAVLSCSEPGDITPGCALSDPAPCPAKYNKTEFISVDDLYDCERVIAEKEGLFPTPLPDFPVACLSDG